MTSSTSAVTASKTADGPLPRNPGHTRALTTISRHSRATIEQRYELDTTVVGLGLASDIEVPIGLNDRFVLREQLGRGSMGLVYLADDEALGRRVAIKVVARRSGRERLEQRLRREAQALAALDHQHVVKVFDIGVDGDELFIAMEHVAGEDLRKWQSHPDRTRAELLEAYVQAGRGLAAAHEADLVHRDFKPDNVFVEATTSGGVQRMRVRVGDFGLAGEDLDQAATTQPASGIRGSLTSSRTLLGTPSYMAPEQLRHEQADARSDQHQFCVALWEALVGQRPFGPGPRPLDGDGAVPDRPRSMPRGIHRILRRGLAFARDDRFPSMHALLDALELYRRRGPRVRRWVGLGGAVGAALGTAVLAVVMNWPKVNWPNLHSACQPPSALQHEVFDGEERNNIRDVLVSQDHETGGNVSSYVLGNLDRAKNQWIAAKMMTCQAREQRMLEPPRIERQEKCLERWRDQIERRIARISSPGGARLADQLVAPLEYVGHSCEMPPIPIDPSIERALDDVEQARLLLYRDVAVELANGAVLQANEAPMCPSADPNGPLRSSELAAAYYELGRAQAELGSSEAALESLELAHMHANACDDRHRDADARIHAAKVLATDFGRVSEADRALEEATVALRHVEEPPVSLRRFEERMAASLIAVQKRGRDELARIFAEEARQALGEHDDPVLYAKLLLNIGVALQQSGRYDEADRAYEEAIAQLGEHPALARLYAERRALNLGLVAVKGRDIDAIRSHLGTAAASDDPTIKVKALAEWAQGEFEANNEQAASAKAAELLDFLDTGPSLSPVTSATVKTKAGQILAELGEPRGIDALDQVCPVWRGLEDEKNETLCQLSRAWGLYELERYDDARSVVTRLLSLELSQAVADQVAELEVTLRSVKQPRRDGKKVRSP